MFAELVKKHAIIKLNEINAVRHSRPLYKLEDHTFPEQLNFITSSARFKLACCSRRGGKTYGIGEYLVQTATTAPEYNCLYITKTRAAAKEIMWDVLKLLCEKRGMRPKVDFIPNESELFIYFPAIRTRIYLKGANDKKQIEKLRGPFYKLVVIDEAQIFTSYLQTMIEEILENSISDLQGTLCLTGTPNATCAGYFYRACHSVGWDKHHWTWRENKFFLEKAFRENKSLTSSDQILLETCQRRNVKIDDPAIRREWFGQWVKSADLQVYKYSAELCDYQSLPSANDWQYVMGVDLGFDDSDSIIISCFSARHRECYNIECFKMAKQTISELAREIARFNQKYNPYLHVIDSGGLGKKIQEELNTRFRFSFIAAEKERKREFIELLNDEIHQGFVKIKKESALAQEMELLVWDEEHFENNKFVEDASFDNHCCDAFLYSWRAIYNYRYESPIKVPSMNSTEYGDYLMQQTIEKINSRNSDDFERDFFRGDN